MNSRWLASILPVLALAACSGSPLRGDVYRDDGLAFRIGEVPPTWARIELKNARLAFRDESAESTVLVNARCGKDADDVPLIALTQHLFIMFTERDTIEQKVVQMDGREAMHTALSAKLDGVQKMFDAYVLKKDGCVFDFVSISPPPRFEGNRAAFQRFVAGFHTIREDG